LQFAIGNCPIEKWCCFGSECELNENGNSRFKIQDVTGELMVKLTWLLAIIALAATTMLAQSANKKKATDSETNGPTKVTGLPSKLPDGLQYWDIKVGAGKEAKKGDSVKVNYTGWLTNGKKFDSSIGRGPFTVQPLGNAPVIKGWNEGIVGMKVGGKRQLRIPADLAYGQQGYPGVIPPNSTLIFDVELLGVQ
jgi:FKBP-type peptidyl-prolyl cis-trans isomerase